MKALTGLLLLVFGHGVSSEFTQEELREMEARATEAPEAPAEAVPRITGGWCACGKCRQMPTEVEMLHSLQYFYTASSGLTTFPEFVIVGMVDGVQFSYYDSNTQRTVLKQDWMEQYTRDDPDYLERDTGNSLGHQQWFKANIGNLKKNFNQTGGVW
ncbi:unnamed protein product [Gadus morhua 'NCC']